MRNNGGKKARDYLTMGNFLDFPNLYGFFGAVLSIVVFFFCGLQQLRYGGDQPCGCLMISLESMYEDNVPFFFS
jgi:hypothetical protein